MVSNTLSRAIPLVSRPSAWRARFPATWFLLTSFPPANEKNKRLEKVACASWPHLFPLAGNTAGSYPSNSPATFSSKEFNERSARLSGIP